jgi:stage II sporulation protein AA (anti-sigma F factor antagonist)
MKLQLKQIGRDGIIRVAADGSITATDIDISKNLFEGILGPSWPQMRVVLDMDKCQYVDSSAIGWLIATNREFKKGGGAVVLYGVQQSVRQVLDLLKVGRVVPIVDDEAAALAVIANGNGGAQ